MQTILFSEHVTEDIIKKAAELLIAPLHLSSNNTVAVKVHFGEHGNSRFIKPAQIQPIIDVLRTTGCTMFVSDCNTLYKGRRVKGTEHKALAVEHGFGSLGIPIVIGDGEDGKDEYLVQIDGRHFTEVRIGKAYKEADTLIIVSHFKGHGMEGFGGAIKNAGMGMGSRRGKMEMHASVGPKVTPSKCIVCGRCKDSCDHDAITITEKTARIDDKKCVGCAMCVSACPTGAIMVPWGSSTSEELIERTVEYAKGAVLGKKVAAFNFAIDITSECDCMRDSEIISEDVGFLAGTDLVALDQASFDKTLEQNGGDDVFKDSNGVNALRATTYGEEIGLGKKEYTLSRL